MPTMTLQILKFVDFRKTPKSRYLESKTLRFLQIKKFINYTSRATLWQKIVSYWRKSLTDNMYECLINCNHKSSNFYMNPKLHKSKELNKMIKIKILNILI